MESKGYQFKSIEKVSFGEHVNILDITQNDLILPYCEYYVYYYDNKSYEYYYTICDYIHIIKFAYLCNVSKNANYKFKELKINIMNNNEIKNKLLDPKYYEVVSNELCLTKYNKIYVKVSFKRIEDGKIFSFCYFEPKKTESK